MIQLTDIHKSYQSNHVLRGITQQFGPGVHGIVGQNGAGKTTLFKCIAGLERYSGAVDSSADVLKNRLGYLATRPYFFSKMTGREYIRLILNARSGRSVDIDARNIFDLPLDQYATTYSTGMKKKLALLTVLLQENQYYILDEPFNGVDIQSNFLIVEIIKELKNLGKTILASSHIFSSLSQISDRIYLLDEGVIKKSVDKSEFNILEKEMINATIGKSIDSLQLST